MKYSIALIALMVCLTHGAELPAVEGVAARTVAALTDGLPASGLGADYRLNSRLAVTAEYRRVELTIPRSRYLPRASGNAHAASIGMSLDVLRGESWRHGVAAGPVVVIAETDQLLTRTAYGAAGRFYLHRSFGDDWGALGAASVAYIGRMRVEAVSNGNKGWIRDGVIADFSVAVTRRF